MRKTVKAGVLAAGALFFLASCQTQSTETQPVSSSTAGESSTLETSSPKVEESRQDTASEVPHDVNELFAKAVDMYRATFPDSDITSVSYDISRVADKYEIEGVDDETEYSLSLFADTFDIKEMEQESLDDDERGGVKRSQEKLDMAKLLPVQEVINLAEAEVGKGQQVEWEVTKDDGLTVWEVDIRLDNNSVEVTIDNDSKRLIEVDR
ncbi:PepSY domain-containing protein [Vagococcus acidifermentans]|uniref:PepSY domain-containing protein n=1 Tax=Vagococcus acidifermentans TaxID=564710 RepID=A0A430B0J2_9ENTE|nr:PepSY domain-containing protein [Vagococcus acidifermentans]RSU13860.1 hypothetical protein CBF27_02875 [Vagococcus acidifermentans]